MPCLPLSASVCLCLSVSVRAVPVCLCPSLCLSHLCSSLCLSVLLSLSPLPGRAGPPSLLASRDPPGHPSLFCDTFVTRLHSLLLGRNRPGRADSCPYAAILQNLKDSHGVRMRARQTPRARAPGPWPSDSDVQQRPVLSRGRPCHDLLLRHRLPSRPIRFIGPSESGRPGPGPGRLKPLHSLNVRWHRRPLRRGDGSVGDCRHCRLCAESAAGTAAAATPIGAIASAAATAPAPSPTATAAAAGPATPAPATPRRAGQPATATPP
jgi:hypothetical protein